MRRIFLPVLVAASGVSVGFSQTYTNGAWSYTLSGGTNATIAGYSGAGGAVSIPASIGGYPVRTVGTGLAPIFGQPNTTVTSVTIPASVTSIGWGAFQQCSNLASVTIPNSVTNIGTNAFNVCSSLTNVTIPDSVTSIGAGAFNNCRSLTNVTIPSSVTSIGNAAFRLCGLLTNVTIPDGVKSIGAYLFAECTSLTNVAIPDSVTSIGDWAFSSCTSLTSVAIPDSVTSIGDQAFYNCSSLTSVAIPDSLTSIGDYAFGECTSLTSVAIPDGVTSIGDWAFSACRSLTNVTIPDGVTSIGDGTFSSCSSLTGVTIPDSVTSIGDSAFKDCTGLVNVTIGNRVTGIGRIWRYAFNGCASLTGVTIGSGQWSISGWAFTDCYNLSSVYILGNAPFMPDSQFARAPIFDDNPSGIVYYTAGTTGWTTTTFAGWPIRIFSPYGNLIVEESNGTALVSGEASSTLFLSLVGQSSPARSYIIRNSGGTSISNIAITKAGSGNSNFSVTPPVTSSLAPGATTAFSVSFSPGSAGPWTALCSVASDDTNSSSFIVNIAGFGLGENLDTDGDGLNDAAEFTMSALGFNWEVAQPSLVNVLYTNANRAKLFSELQYNGSRAAGRQDVLSSPAGYNLYTSDSIMDLRLSGAMVQKHGEMATVVFQPQTTVDLTTQPFTNNGTPITNVIPMPGNKGFLRIQAKPE